MTRIGAIVGILVLSGTGILAQAKKPTSADEAAIGNVRTAFEQAVRDQNAAAAAKLFAPDGDEMPPNVPIMKGRAAIEGYHKRFAAQFMVHGVTITPTETRVLGTTGYDVGTYTQTLMSQQNGAMLEDKGKYVVILKKDPSAGWLITHLIYNSDNPPPPSAGPKK